MFISKRNLGKSKGSWGLANVRARDHSAQPSPFAERETEAQRAEITCQSVGSRARLGLLSLRNDFVLNATGLKEHITLLSLTNTNYFCKRVCLLVLVGSRERVLPPLLSEQLPASA